MPRWGWCLLTVLWGVAAAGGYWLGLDYASINGHLNDPVAIWPKNSGITRDSQRPTFVVFIHPKCPCTRATVRELDRLLARYRDRMTVYVVVYHPAAAAAGWEQTDLVASARELPGVQLVVDQDDVCLRAFGPSTSGECLLYSQSGKLLFQGGLTPARGHEGATLGQAAITALLRGESNSYHQSPVFGCSFESTNCPQGSR